MKKKQPNKSTKCNSARFLLADRIRWLAFATQSLRQALGEYDLLSDLSLSYSSPALNDDTKILTETDTETFFTIPNFPKPKPRLFSETKFLRNRNRYFSSETKFFETETETFFRDQIFPKPKLRLFSETKFFQTETETLKNLAKVSRPRPKPRLLNIF